jgi:serpin B
VLHLGGPTDRTLEILGSLVATYGAPGQRVTIRIANRLFGEKTYAFEQTYLKRIDKAFGAPLEPVDFKTAAEASRQRINAWVATETADRIKDLVPAGGVDTSTRLSLVNAIYFLGDWEDPFEKTETHAAPFFVSKDSKKDVSTMHQTARLRFTATGGVKVLELPYRSSSLAMDFVLPDAVDGLASVEARLTPALIDSWLALPSSSSVVVSLPKFELAPADPLSLSGTLSAMGMPLAFDRQAADLTGIGTGASPDDRLFIGNALHKAFVRTDEKGTEAVAATALTLMAGGGMPSREPPMEFKADHPFLFFLRDTQSGLVLFMGRVADPTAR